MLLAMAEQLGSAELLARLVPDGQSVGWTWHTQLATLDA